jgi:hypothetical protein
LVGRRDAAGDVSEQAHALFDDNEAREVTRAVARVARTGVRVRSAVVQAAGPSRGDAMAQDMAYSRMPFSPKGYPCRGRCGTRARSDVRHRVPGAGGRRHGASRGTPHYTPPNRSVDRPRRAYIINYVHPVLFNRGGRFHPANRDAECRSSCRRRAARIACGSSAPSCSSCDGVTLVRNSRLGQRVRAIRRPARKKKGRSKDRPPYNRCHDHLLFIRPRWSGLWRSRPGKQSRLLSSSHWRSSGVSSRALCR